MVNSFFVGIPAIEVIAEAFPWMGSILAILLAAFTVVVAEVSVALQPKDGFSQQWAYGISHVSYLVCTGVGCGELFDLLFQYWGKGKINGFAFEHVFFFVTFGVLGSTFMMRRQTQLKDMHIVTES
ncbi:MAG: hypothetical protein JWM11_7310 [Planctomycetaceae bacterium]|nr:hypothetical protein [Planctomycetaceae bacterium]